MVTSFALYLARAIGRRMLGMFVTQAARRANAGIAGFFTKGL